MKEINLSSFLFNNLFLYMIKKYISKKGALNFHFPWSIVRENSISNVPCKLWGTYTLKTHIPVKS